MPILLLFLLFVISNTLQSEESNPTCLDRPKRRAQDDGLKNVVGRDTDKSKVSGNSSVFETILKDIDDIVALKKDEINYYPPPGTGDVESAHSAIESRESDDKSPENDPLTTQFYTFSKATVEEPKKDFTWIQLFSSPIIQSLLKSKEAAVKKKTVLPNHDGFRLEDTSKLNGLINAKNNSFENVDFNKIIDLISAIGKCNSKKDTNIQFPNGESSTDLMKEKKSCLVENKSNFFKADQDPYSKIIKVSGPSDFIDRVNTALSNYTSLVGKFHNPNQLNFDNLSSMDRKNVKLSNPTSFLRGQIPKMTGEFKMSRWFNFKNRLTDVTNTTNPSPRSNLAVQKDKEHIGEIDKNSFDVLSEINLDVPPTCKTPSVGSLVETNHKNINITKLQNIPRYNLELQQPLKANKIITNAFKLNLSDASSIDSLNLQSLLQAPDTLEKICLLNKILFGNQLIEPSKPLFLAQNDISPLLKQALNSKFIDCNADIKAISNYILSRQVIDALKTSPENKTSRLLNANKKWNNTAVCHFAVEPSLNKSSVFSIGEQESSPLPLDVKPGSPRITLPEYEKMENGFETRYPEPYTSTEIKYNVLETTTSSVEISNNPTQPPSQTLQTDKLHTLHQNMIPVIDFLGQMWNSSNKRNQNVIISSTNNRRGDKATDCGGYVIVPLPDTTMFRGWKRLEKAAGLVRDAEFRDSGLVHSPFNYSTTMITSFNRDLLEKFIMQRLFDSFQESLSPKRRERRSEGSEDVENIGFWGHSTSSVSPVDPKPTVTWKTKLDTSSKKPDKQKSED